MKKIELWCDSFHEGDWACNHLSNKHKNLGLKFSVTYEKGFIPTYKFFFKKEELEIKIFGSYTSWSPLPEEIKNLISWGKPDFLAYDPLKKKIIFAVEETAAIPTGNQALQRCERLYGASRSKIPFWYLLAEYGIHKDEGVRRDSIWPTIMAIKLSLKNHTPSCILHYSDKENPEGYDFGKGVNSLFNALYKILENFTEQKDKLSDLKEILIDHYGDMLRFLKSQHKNIIEYLPGIEKWNDKELLYDIVNITLSNDEKLFDDFKKKNSKFLYWPSTQQWYSDGGDQVKSSKLIKHDNFSEALEKSIDKKVCYVISSNTGSRPQRIKEVKDWLSKQIKSFDIAAKKLKLKNKFNVSIKDFPKTVNGNIHLTTSKNIIYLFDNFYDLKEIIYNIFPSNKKKLDNIKNLRTIVYISNSIKPGRIFGDPFTGQISAYSVSFGKFDIDKRLVVSYFPHQSFSQFLDTNNKIILNKGFTIMRELVDLVILGGGVMIKFSGNKAEVIR
jgi:hypothetical protein